MGDVQDARLSVELLDDVQRVASDDVVRALEVVHDLGHVDRATALLGLNRLSGHVLAVEALHRIRDVRDALDVLLGLVGQAVEALRGVVRLNLLSAGHVIQLQHQPGGSALHLQLFDGHVLQGAGLDLPAAVRRGVHHMQFLTGDLVEQFLRAEQVFDQPDRPTVAEVGEVGDHREVLVRRPVVVQHHVVSGDRPTDALDQLLCGGDPPAGLLQHGGDLVAVPAFRHRAHIASLDIDEVQLLVQPAVLAVEQADVAAQAVRLRDAVVTGQRQHSTKAVAHTLDRVVAVGEAGAVLDLQVFGVVLRVQDGHVLRGHPLGREHVVPLIRVVFLGVRVDHDVLRVQVLDAQLAEHAVSEVQPHVEEPPGADHAVGEQLGAHPRQLVVLTDLLEHLGQYLGQLRRGAAGRAEDRLAAVVNLLAEQGAEGGDDLVDRDCRPALERQRIQISLIPLLPGEETITFIGFIYELQMPAIAAILKACPLFAGEGVIDRHRGVLTSGSAACTAWRR